MTSRAALRVLVKRFKIPLNTSKQMTEETVQHKLTTALQVFFQPRPDLPKWREEFQVGLVQTLVSDQDKSPIVIMAQMKGEKHQRTVGKNPEIFDKRMRKTQSYGQQQPIATARYINAPIKRIWWKSWQCQTYLDNNKAPLHPL